MSSDYPRRLKGMSNYKWNCLKREWRVKRKREIKERHEI